MSNEFFSNHLVTAAATEMIKQPIVHIMNTWLRPKLEKMKEKQTLNRKMEELAIEVFSEYLKRSYGNLSCVNLLVLGNQQIYLSDIYQPLTIKTTEKGSKSEQLHSVNRYDDELSNKYRKILIEDTAGMGKSTLMRKLFISAIEENAGIPIFIELRRISKGRTITEHIINDLNSINEQYDKDFVNELIRRGDFIFFFDGFDEIPFDIKNEVIDHLKEFISKTGNNFFYLTSRNDEALKSFGDFQRFEIEKLIREEAFELLGKYDQIAQLDLSPSLIKQIEQTMQSENFNDLDSFLGNPLLVSLIYVTYKHKRDVPIKKDQFYRKVYDALYEDHDLSKDGFKRKKHSGLSSDALHKLLRKLGFLCLRNNKIEYDKDKILNLIDQAKDDIYYNGINSSDVLKDILYSVPLFIEDGLAYRWAHKSFMEYFAAYFIYIDNSTNRRDVVEKIFNSERLHIYTNLLDLYYDIDQDTFDQVITYKILNDFLAHMGNVTGKSRKYIELKALYYNRIYYINNDLGEIDTEELFGRDKIIPIILQDLKEIYGDKVEGYSPSSMTYSTLKNLKLSALLTRNHKIESILKLLVAKSTPFLKKYNRRSKRTPIFEKIEGKMILTHFDLDNQEMTDKSLEETIKIICNKILSGRNYCIEYFGAKEYKDLLDKQKTKNNDDLFSDI